MTIEINVSPSYPVSMTGIQAGGKGTLRDGLAAMFEGWRPLHYHLLQLGRMVDLEGLSVFRERYLEQDALIRQTIEGGRWPVTARLGVLDVAVVTCVMAGLGRVDEAGAHAFLDRVGDDLPVLLFPRSLVAVVCQPVTVQQRLAARDQARGVKPSRGSKALAAMATRLNEIHVEGRSPHPVVARIVDHYRNGNLLLVVDTSELGETASLHRVTTFLRTSGVIDPNGSADAAADAREGSGATRLPGGPTAS